MFFFLNSAAVLNAFAKAKAKCLKPTIMKVIVFFQVKCLLWVKVVNTGIALWLIMTNGSRFYRVVCIYS